MNLDDLYNDDEIDNNDLSSDEEEEEEVDPDLDDSSDDEEEELGNVIPVNGLYQDWFLDYASYVILERAVPNLHDGLKPVQRRILHSMKELEDGRYNKVANVIGNTMKYHPHGDTSIGDAMVQVGQKDLLIDMQGNWGNILTGDRAAAARYIEARLSKFALDVIYSPKVTEWIKSYDGRNDEPLTLPVKFPLLLAQGTEGIAVGMACKIMPHNFIELIDGCIQVLKGKKTNILPDFPTAGMADFSNYNDGLRGGKIRVRCKISKLDKKTLVINELPFGCTTSSLIDSILKANDKGKIKIRKVEDNTAEFVEIIVHLGSNVSPDKSIDALYAFTDCESSISPNASVINGDTPMFIGVNEILKNNALRAKDLLLSEQQIRLAELQEQWHFTSLERIFIEKKVYRKIEDCETWESVISTIDKGLKPHVKHLLRKVTEDDIVRLTEIKIKRISKFDSFKADDLLARLEADIDKVKNNIENITDFTIDYFKNIKKKYGTGRERKTEIRTFEKLDASKVVVTNQKLYVNKEEGFVGYGLKKDEFIRECSDIDDVIVILKNGTMMVSKISSKAFFGKDILHCDVWKKGDERTVYNLIYSDGPKGAAMVKRFNVTSITRDKEYNLTKGTAGSKLLYFTANPNGEAEIVHILLKANAKARKLGFDFDFSKLAIKSRSAKGNILSKFPVSKVNLKREGISTLEAQEIYFDDTVQRLNIDGRGVLLGKFSGDDKILAIHQSGEYKLYGYGLSTHFEEDWILIEKWNPKKPVSAVYWDAEKQQYNVKRFLIEPTDRKVCFIGEHEENHLEVASLDWLPMIEVVYRKTKKSEKEPEEVNVAEFISVKGLKAIGNKLTSETVNQINILESLPFEEPEEENDNDESSEQGELFNESEDLEE